MIFGECNENTLIFTGGILERTVFGGDFLRARNAGREVAVRLRILLNGGKHLLPLYKLGLLRLKRQYVSRRLLKPLLNGIAARMKIVHLVGGSEVKQLLGDLIDLTALLLDVAVDVGDSLVATHLVLLVGESLNCLGIRIGERCSQGGSL